MQHACDYRKFTLRINDRTYQFTDLESTRAADRAITYFLKLKQQEMLALREELARPAKKESPNG